MKHVALLMLLALTGCFEDKGAILAQCQLDYKPKPGIMDQGAETLLCMRSHGYVFREWRFAKLGTWTAEWDQEENKCYDGSVELPRVFISECYEARHS